MNDSISETEYQTVILACADLIALGVPYEDTITDPMGPCGKLAGVADFDTLADCVLLAVMARRLPDYSAIQMKNVLN